MTFVSGRVAAVAALATMATVGLANPAAASQPVSVSCGQVITASTTLNGDVGPCPDNGIVIGANDVTLNLHGHRIFGTPAPGDGAGVLVSARTGVRVENGAVSDFDGGIVIQGGKANTVRKIVASDNIGSSGGPAPATLYGDGILLEGSIDNVIVDNVTNDNGPFSGIGLIQVPDSDHTFPAQPTTGNLIARNTVTDNIACRTGPFCDNDGIRVEPQVAGNAIVDNQVTGNGLDGISLFVDSDNNVVAKNTVDNNGFNGAVPGDGIRVFASRNLIDRNSVRDNAAGGVSVGRRSISPPGSLPSGPTGNPRGKDNRIIGNLTGGNGVDLYDSNPGCDSNVWSDNIFQTARPACTTG
ncbi:MAG TPA: right-handed parallel beta-helix repeat-containing protein [Acidimicrobiales bacterium]|jgi:parallel beta-helix repeat protein|nr:right-handed parallel beta-helix repeat-containing protein [Acidimicrobiales bacterium]